MIVSKKNRFIKKAIFKCPHCFKTLERIKKRKDFYVYSVKIIAVLLHTKANSNDQRREETF